MKTKTKLFFSAVVMGLFLISAFASGESKNNSDNSSESESIYDETSEEQNTVKTSFNDGDELFDFVSYGHYSYDDLVNMWGEAEVGKPYLNDRNDGFNVCVTWGNINVNGVIPEFEFSCWNDDFKSPLTFKGFKLNGYVFEY